MGLSRRRKILIAVLSVGVIALAAYVFLVSWVSVAIVAAHQRSTTRELAGWEREYSQISTEKEAERAADMLEYARRYYNLGEGYRSDPETEERLEAQRRRTIESIAGAIEEYRKAKGSSPAPTSTN
jgi:flagellar basal body-associated protein FliL